MSVSDSDDDYCDVGAVDATTVEEPINVSEVPVKNANAVRGKDIVWIEYKLFESSKEFNESELHTELKKTFTMKTAREVDYADTENFSCKYARRKGFIPCPLKYKVNFLSHSDSVTVESNAVHPRHIHEEDSEYVLSSVMFRWSVEQTNTIVQGVRNEAKPKVIRRNMEDANLFSDGRIPTSLQLNNKIRHVRKLLHGSSQIVNTHELREKIQEYLEIPSDANKAYIAVNNVEDDDETAEPRFNIIWTTHKLMERISDNLTQDDATYRLVWQGMFNHIDVILCVSEGFVFTPVKHYILLATCMASNV